MNRRLAQINERQRALVLALPIGLILTIILHAEHIAEQLRGLAPYPQVLIMLLIELASSILISYVTYCIIRTYQSRQTP